MKFEIAVCRETKPDLFSRLIMLFTKRPYSHAFVIVDDFLIYEAVGKGICRNTVGELLKDGSHVIVERVAVGSDYLPGSFEAGFALGWLECSVGTVEYSLSQCLAIVLPFLRPIVKNARKKSICSEFAATFLRDGLKIKHPSLLCCDFLTPGDVVDIAKGCNP